MAHNIGFISTRFSGTDGVSLESAKWAEVLWDDNHVSHWYAGRLDRSPGISLCIPEAHFDHPENEWINQHLWGQRRRTPQVSRRIRELSVYLKHTLYDYVRNFDINILVVQNALAIPMHVPLGLAITEFIEETGIPTIAHHHDFYWERMRFQMGGMRDYLDVAFPPRSPPLQHVVINQAAKEELAWRKGVSSMLIPNVLQFENTPPEADDYCADIREAVGLEEGDRLILQPTRVVPRKGIEHSIMLLSALKDRRNKLVISHMTGDEGFEYARRVVELAADEGVDFIFFGNRIGEVRHLDDQGRKIYTLQDLYLHADMVTFPSLYEGFGNALLEAIYFKLPVVVNRYPVFARDIEAKHFRLAVMDGFVDRTVIDEVKHIMHDDEYRQQMVQHNFDVASQYYSYRVLRYSLQKLIQNVENRTY